MVDATLRKWVAPGIIVAAILAVFFWLAWPSAPEVAIANAPQKVVPQEEEPAGVIADRPDAGKVEEKPAPKKKIDINSPEFVDKVDIEIPRKLYQRAVDCYHVRLDKDQKIKFIMQMRSVNGEIEVVDAKIDKNTVTDEKAADCIIRAIKTAKWKDEEMPDWADEEELLVRLGALKKYMPEDWEPEEVPYTGPAEDPPPVGEGGPEGN